MLCRIDTPSISFVLGGQRSDSGQQEAHLRTPPNGPRPLTRAGFFSAYFFCGFEKSLYPGGLRGRLNCPMVMTCPGISYQ